MAFVRKVNVVRYLDDNGKQVPKGTPGAQKVTEESRKWYIFYRVNGRQKREAGFTDKQATIAKMTRLVKAIERGQEGLTDPYKEHRERPVLAHLEDYLPVLHARVSNSDYRNCTEITLRKILRECQITSLDDLKSETFEKYLTRLKKKDGTAAAPNTKKKFHSAMNGFCDWLFRQRRLEENPVARVPTPTGGVKVKPRSLTKQEIQLLLDTTRTRPEREALLIRRGARKGQLAARVRPEVRAQLQQEGRERGLLYKTSSLTGLRKEELARLIVADIDFDHKPYPVIDPAAERTKGKSASALWLVPELAEELRQWIADTAKKPEDRVFTVPVKLNNIFKRDLKAAGIVAKTAKGVAKFRSLRKSTNVLLRELGLDLKTRQVFMRHADVRLTSDTYDDGRLTDIVSVVPALQMVGLR